MSVVYVWRAIHDRCVDKKARRQRLTESDTPMPRGLLT
jgi:hypothetical protein